MKHQDEMLVYGKELNHPCQKSAGEGRPQNQPAPVN